MRSAESERLFVGAEPPAALRRRLYALAAAQPEVLGGNWHAMEAADLHLTLCFIGVVRTLPGPGPDRAVVERDLAGLCRSHGPVTGDFEGLEFWPPMHPRMAVVTMRASPALFDLAERCRDLARGWERPDDRRLFRPHLTLARGRALASPVEVRATNDLPALRIDHLCLFRARPGHRPRYEVVWRGGLAGPGPAAGG